MYRRTPPSQHVLSPGLRFKGNSKPLAFIPGGYMNHLRIIWPCALVRLSPTQTIQETQARRQQWSLQTPCSPFGSRFLGSTGTFILRKTKQMSTQKSLPMCRRITQVSQVCKQESWGQGGCAALFRARGSLRA